MEDLLQHVIYDHPRDHPGYWVVRTWMIGAGTIRHEDKATLFLELDVARAWIQQEYPGVVMLKDTDPSVYEVWL